MKDFWKFIKTSGIYFIGSISSKLITFLLLPVYTSYIDPEGMGIYDSTVAVVTFICSVIFLDIWSGIMRFTYEYKNEEQKKPVTNGIAIFLVSCILYTLVVFCGQLYMKVDYIQYIYTYGLLTNMQNLCGYLARTQGKNVLYTSAGILSSFVHILSNIVLIVVFKMDYSALFLSSCIGCFFNIIVISIGIRLHRLISIKAFEWKLAKRMFCFSLPLCVNSVAYWFLSSYNRVAIVNILGNSENGMYSIASRFGSFITLFTTCFTMAWQELSYLKEAKGLEDKGNFYSTAINTYIRFLGMGLVISIPFISLIYPIMINGSYAEGKTMVPIYLLATIASAVGSFLGNIFTAIKKNNILFYTTVAGSIVNVVTVHLLLPTIGIEGASIALFLGFAVNCFMRIRALNKQFHLTLDLKFLGLLTFLFLLVYWVYTLGTLFMNICTMLLGVLITLLLFRESITKIVKDLVKKIKYRNNY